MITHSERYFFFSAAVYHVWDGIDSCRVGFLKHHFLKHWKRYDGVLAQIIDVYSKESESNSQRRQFYHNKGCCVAAIISSLSDATIEQLSIEKRGAPYSDDEPQTKRQRAGADGSP
jgi:hypothetical protein